MKFTDIQQELSENFIEYAVAVNTDRAIPDAKTGLKPVARRILWSAYTRGMLPNKPHVKCADIVGNVMGRFHPHGDSSIYGALVRLSQNWIMRYPLIDGHGNFGNIDGDGPAAYRYTEARLSKIAEEGLLVGMKKNIVDFVPNYSETEDEPVTLPSIFPNLLCNPNTGIGVSIASTWLPHNLKEVAQAINDYIDGKEPKILAPDFPTGGLIINGDEVPNMIKLGRGSVKLRGKYNIEKNKIIFYEIPYGIKTEDLLTEIGKIAESEIEGISDIRNESNKKGIRIVIECAKGIIPEQIVNKLFQKTNLQTSLSYNQVALVDKVPIELGLKDCIKIYLNHNIDCLKKEISFDLRKAKERKEIVEGLIKAIEDIDNIIALIKKSNNSSEAKTNLIKTYSFTENQAKAIIDMKLGKLAKLEGVELNEELEGLTNSIIEMNNVLASEEEQIFIIRTRLNELVRKFGDERRTEITNIKVTKEEKKVAEIIPEDVTIVVTKQGYLKRLPRNSFKPQNRNTKGTKINDIVTSVYNTTTLDQLLVFTSLGKVYKLDIDDIPACANTALGSSIYNLIKFKEDEKFVTACAISRNEENKFVIFMTQNGLIKKTPLSEYSSLKKKTGIIATKLKGDDKIIDIHIADNADCDAIIVTRGGYALRFNLGELNVSSRTSQGFKAINLHEGDEILHLHLVKKDFLVLLRENGNGCLININSFKTQKRGGRGVIALKNNLVDSENVNKDDLVLISSKSNNVCIKVADISIMERGVSSGVKLIKSDNAQSIICL